MEKRVIDGLWNSIFNLRGKYIHFEVYWKTMSIVSTVIKL